MTDEERADLQKRIDSAAGRMRLRNVGVQIGPDVMLNLTWEVKALRRIIVAAGLATDEDVNDELLRVQCDELERLAGKPVLASSPN